MDRRSFNKAIGASLTGLLFHDAYSLTNQTQKNIKISLAQWSLNDMIQTEKTLDAINFPVMASALGFDAVEYVSTLYWPFLEKNSFNSLKNNLVQKSSTNNIKNLLIMVDEEGDLASSEKNKIHNSIENHKRWIELAKTLGCHSVRVNLNGEKNIEKWSDNSKYGLSKLCEFASDFDINIIVENHGGNSSNGKELAKVLKSVNLNNCGSLPDFGNFCIQRENGSMYSGPCEIEYDKYQGMRDLMPYAKAVSVKSYDFDEFGEETTIDFEQMFKIIKDFDYNGYLGIEFEGNSLSEIKGIDLTRKLIKKYHH